MRKIFLIPLLTLMCSVLAWADGHSTQQPEDVAEMTVVNGDEITVTYFATLQDAFDALPQNSYPATVKVLKNTSSTFTNNALTIKKFQNVTLDLNGKIITSHANNVQTSNMIQNHGTLTIDDSSDGKQGKLTGDASNPDVINPNGFVGYATNIIKNAGSIYMKAGTIECTTPTLGASYCIDMYYQEDNAGYVEISGGQLINEVNPCIRVSGHDCRNQTLNINGGTLRSGRRTIWIQNDGGSALTNPRYPTQQVTININGGTLETGAGAGNSTSKNWVIMAEADDGTDWHSLTINVTGGTIKGDFAMDFHESNWQGLWNRVNGNPDLLAKVNISGGTFLRNEHPDGVHVGAFYYRLCNRTIIPNSDPATIMEYPYKTITGGTFQSNPNPEEQFTLTSYGNPGETAEGKQRPMKTWGYYIADGYCANDNGDGTWTVGACSAVTVDDNTQTTEWTDATDYSATDVTVENGAAVVIPQDQTVEVHALDVKGEGQIVVKDGATLVIGNGGLKSENNDLTQVIVEAGGTIAIGNGGITKEGAATPIEIRSDGDKSGVLLIDPNAPAAVAEAPAKVKVYTRAYKDGEIEHWQHIASPVKGEMSITPLGLGDNEQLYTVMYGWNASAGEWQLLENLPLIGNAKAFDKAGWSGTNLLEPFAAYDLINNSPSSKGGITYEFAGELVGNEDLILNFPKNGFSLFGNSYTAPIDLNTLFTKIRNDMTTSLDLAESAIDPCVYVFNSLNNRFESVNALDLLLHEYGLPAAFTQIPAQQAFVMNLIKGNSAQSSVDYAASVWGNPNTNKNVPIMAPKRQQTPSFSGLLNITVTDGNATDRVILVQDNNYSSEYDLGADAMKYMNGAFNLYANTAIGQLDKVASDNIENTELSFKAGNVVNYTMTFNNVIGNYVLVDHANNSQMAIEEGGIYTFAAQPNSIVEGRFTVVPLAKLPTAIENTEVKANVKGIYTLTGQFVGEDFNALPAGVYVVNGVKIVK